MYRVSSFFRCPILAACAAVDCEGVVEAGSAHIAALFLVLRGLKFNLYFYLYVMQDIFRTPTQLFAMSCDKKQAFKFFAASQHPVLGSQIEAVKVHR